MQSNGIVIGIVTDLEDPDRLGRVRVKFTHLNDRESHWARLSAPMAGPDRGTFFRPEVNDEVLVGFLHGDIRFPYILGSLWSTPDKPPADDGKVKENNWRFIKSRSGHIIKLNDTKGSETIEIIDKSNNHKIIIDTSAKKIRIVSDGGDVEVSATKGKVKVDADQVEVSAQNVEVKATNSVKVEGLNVDVKAQGKMTLEATGIMTIKGSLVQIN